MTTTATTGLPDLGANHEGASEDNFLSAGPMSEDTENHWQDRANEVAAWLPTASREALMRFGWRHFQRSESAAWCIAEEHRRAELLAQREASYAVSEALDWSAQSQHPTFAELVQRRSEVA